MTQVSHPRSCTTWLAYAGWAVLLLDVVLALTFEGYQFTEQTIVWLLLLTSWLLGSLFAIAMLLPILYYQYLSSRTTWLILLGLWTMSFLIKQGIILRQFERLQTASLLLLMFDSLAIAMSLCLLLVKRDLGLTIIGWLSIAWVWTGAVIASQQPNIIDALTQFLLLGQPSSLWLFGILSNMLCCLMPLALLSFTGHTLALIIREMNQPSHKLHEQ